MILLSKSRMLSSDCRETVDDQQLRYQVAETGATPPESHRAAVRVDWARFVVWEVIRFPDALDARDVSTCGLITCYAFLLDLELAQRTVRRCCCTNCRTADF